MLRGFVLARPDLNEAWGILAESIGIDPHEVGADRIIIENVTPPAAEMQQQRTWQPAVMRDTSLDPRDYWPDLE